MAERRFDKDGKAYTYDQLAAYYRGRYQEGEIAAYWGTLRVESRVDDRLGMTVTYGELVTRHGLRHSKSEIDAYWESLRPTGAGVLQSLSPQRSQNPWRAFPVPAAKGVPPVPAGHEVTIHRDASVGAKAYPYAAPSPPSPASVMTYQYTLLTVADPSWSSRPREGDAVPPATLAAIVPSGGAAATRSAQPPSSAATGGSSDEAGDLEEAHLRLGTSETRGGLGVSPVPSVGNDAGAGRAVRRELRCGRR